MPISTLRPRARSPSAPRLRAERREKTIIPTSGDADQRGTGRAGKADVEKDFRGERLHAEHEEETDQRRRDRRRGASDQRFPEHIGAEQVEHHAVPLGQSVLSRCLRPQG